MKSVILVTGASTGIGHLTSRALAQAGHIVYASMRDTEGRNASKVRELRDWSFANGLDLRAVELDVLSQASADAAVAHILAERGRLDVVVHNAIYMPLVTFEATAPSEWARQIGVGLGGMFNCARAAWPRMKAQGGGHIIGIASGSSVRGYREEIAYCAVKHGVEGFVKALSLEAREHNIALNTIGPGARIKPTRVTWAEHDRAPAELRASWTDPVRLGQAWVWLAAQPPGRYSGYRFDAWQLVETIAREGEDFEFAPEKVTAYPDDFRARQDWYEHYTG